MQLSGISVHACTGTFTLVIPLLDLDEDLVSLFGTGSSAKATVPFELKLACTTPSGRSGATGGVGIGVVAVGVLIG
jgi:hypothetical protein